MKGMTFHIHASEGLIMVSGDTPEPNYRFDMIPIEIIAAPFFGCRN